MIILLIIYILIFVNGFLKAVRDCSVTHEYFLIKFDLKDQFWRNWWSKDGWKNKYIIDKKYGGFLSYYVLVVFSDCWHLCEYLINIIFFAIALLSGLLFYYFPYYSFNINEFLIHISICLTIFIGTFLLFYHTVFKIKK